MTPVVDGLQQRYESEISFIRIDAGAEGARNVLESLRVRGHPVTIVFDREGKESSRFNGVVDEGALAEALDDVVSR